MIVSLLPFDCIKNIFHYLDRYDLFSIHQTCVYFRQTVSKCITEQRNESNPIFWKNIDIQNDLELHQYTSDLTSPPKNM